MGVVDRQLDPKMTTGNAAGIERVSLGECAGGTAGFAKAK
jgi:hypothetical protein